MSETTREQQKQETRDRILRAARDLIEERGFTKTTMRALAEKAGVGVGTINLHFDDKRSLLFSAFYEEIGAVAMTGMTNVSLEAPLKEQLLSVLRGLYEYYGANIHFLRSVVKEALFAEGVWRDRFQSQVAEMAGRAAEMVETAKARGEVREDVDSTSLAMVCWSLYITVLIDGLGAETFDPDALVRRVEPMLDVVLGGAV